MATLLIEKKSLNVWLHTPSDFQPYIITQLYAKSNGDNFMVFEFSGVQRGVYNFADISIKDGANPIETGFTSINQVMLRLEELKYVGFDFDGDVVPAELISTDPSNKLTTGTDNKLYVPDEGVDDTADHLKGSWNASTNTPPLANGVGQIGDYYVVTNGGTQLSILWGVGDIAAYNGTTWYKFVNNNQSPVLTTNTNITSASLATQDVAGFVAYINALNPIITIENFDIRTYTVTDTGQKFELLLRGRSFGFSQPAITASDVLELELRRGSKYFQCFYQVWTLTNLNMWRTWQRGFSHMVSVDPNFNAGTGTVPNDGTGTNLADSNYLLVSEVSKLRKMTFSIRECISAITIELWVRSITVANGASNRGTETNQQTLIQQSFVIGATSQQFIKDNFTIAAHTFSGLTGIQMAVRVTSGSATLQAVQIKFDFE